MLAQLFQKQKREHGELTRGCFALIVEEIPHLFCDALPILGWLNGLEKVLTSNMCLSDNSCNRIAAIRRYVISATANASIDMWTLGSLGSLVDGLLAFGTEESLIRFVPLAVVGEVHHFLKQIAGKSCNANSWTKRRVRA